MSEAVEPAGYAVSLWPVSLRVVSLPASSFS